MGIEMKIAGMMRIKNEARWIEKIIGAALKVCDRIYVLDDHSTDATPEICRSFAGVYLFPSEFEGLDESRDKNWLFNQVKRSRSEWCLAIDGDEVIEDPHNELREISQRADEGPECFSLQVLYLWNRVDQVRTDGVYGRFFRPSFFRVRDSQTFPTTASGANFHCGSVPQQLGAAFRCGARLLHFGYMDAADRRRKFEWYNRHDPNNEIEDRYQHMVQGDPEGPHRKAKLLHAGPLRLETIVAPVVNR